MAFCGNCGTKTDDGMRFCPSCGTEITAVPAAPTYEAPAPEYTAPAPEYTTPAPEYAAPAQPEPTYSEAPAYQPPVIPGAPTQADIHDAQENKTMAILAYIFFFIPLLVGAHKESIFAKYHTNQGTVLFIVAACWGVAYSILSVIFLFIPVIGLIIVVILGIASLIFPVLCIVGIINAVNGVMKPLPVIGKFEIIK